jgi:hypothetical protein
VIPEVWLHDDGKKHTWWVKQDDGSWLKVDDDYFARLAEMAPPQEKVNPFLRYPKNSTRKGR